MCTDAHGLQFVMKEIVNKHICIHTDDKPFKCDVFSLQISCCDVLKRDMRTRTECGLHILPCSNSESVNKYIRAIRLG